jgi:hypothetical protein
MKVTRSDRRKSARDDDPERRGRRSEPRAYVLLPASAHGHSGSRYVRLLDVSRTGAQLEGVDLPKEGRDIVLRCSHLDTFGTIVWVKADRCGIAFDEPIGLRELAQLRDLGFAIEQSKLTADEIQAAADWMSGLAR